MIERGTTPLTTQKHVLAVNASDTGSNVITEVESQNNTAGGITSKEGLSTSGAQAWMLGFLSVGMVVVLLLGIVMYREFANLVSARATLNKRDQQLKVLDRCLYAIQNAESAQRGFILTGKSIYLEPYHVAVKTIPETMSVLRDLTRSEPHQAAALAKTSTAVDAKLQELARVIEIYRSSGADAARQFVNNDSGNTMMQDIRDRFKEMETAERDITDAESLIIKAGREAFINTFAALGVSALALFAGFVYFMRLYVLVTAKSRTSEELLRQSLLERSKQLEAQAQLLDLTHDTILVRGLDGEIKFWNRGAERTYGFKPEEAVGRTSHSLLGTMFPEPIEEINKRLLANGRWDGELVHYANDGRRVVVASRWALKTNAEGEPFAVMEINSDITAQKEAEQKLLNAIRDRSEQRLKKVIEAAPNGIMLMGVDGKINLVNSQIENLFGASRTKILNRSVQDFIPELIAQQSNGESSGRTTLPDGGEVKGAMMEFLVHPVDGIAFPVDVGLSSLVSDGYAYVIASIVDARARKLAEAQTAELAAIVNSSEDAIVSVGLDGIVRSWNRAAEKVFGFRADEMIGSAVSRIFPPDKLAEEEQILSSLKAGKSISQLETVRQKKDGARFFASVNVYPIRNADADLIAVSKITRDVTDRVRDQEDLKHKMLELERSNDELKQFAYVCSHDLQEPLRVISNFNQLLAKRYRGKLDERADEYIEFTVDAAKRMQILINDLLTYSRVQTKERKLRMLECSSVVRGAMANLKIAIEEAGARVDVGELPPIMGDPVQLTQLFQNLLGNALKFRSSEAPVIRVTATKEGQHWLFCLQDNGIGMDMQFADKIFVIFQRLHDRESYAGSGIGLAICKKIVNQHGGRIWVESEPGKGSSFYFTLAAESLDVFSSLA